MQLACREYDPTILSADLSTSLLVSPRRHAWDREWRGMSSTRRGTRDRRGRGVSPAGGRTWDWRRSGGSFPRCRTRNRRRGRVSSAGSCTWDRRGRGVSPAGSRTWDWRRSGESFPRCRAWNRRRGGVSSAGSCAWDRRGRGASSAGSCTRDWTHGGSRCRARNRAYTLTRCGARNWIWPARTIALSFHRCGYSFIAILGADYSVVATTLWGGETLTAALHRCVSSSRASELAAHYTGIILGVEKPSFGVLVGPAESPRIVLRIESGPKIVAITMTMTAVTAGAGEAIRYQSGGASGDDDNTVESGQFHNIQRKAIR